MDKICVVCGATIKFSVKWSYAERINKKYCSLKCCNEAKKGVHIPNAGHFNKGHKTWNEGVTGYFSEEIITKAKERLVNYIKSETPEQREHRLRGLRNGPRSRGKLGRIGELDSQWKGEAANYNSKHRWIQNHWTKTGKCEECGEIKIPNPLKRLKVATYWHNPTQTYRRERNEWMEVCAKCHYKLDKINK